MKTLNISILICFFFINGFTNSLNAQKVLPNIEGNGITAEETIYVCQGQSIQLPMKDGDSIS